MSRTWYGIIALSVLGIQPVETMAEEPIESSPQELLRAGRLVPGGAVYATRLVGRRRATSRPVASLESRSASRLARSNPIGNVAPGRQPRRPADPATPHGLPGAPRRRFSAGAALGLPGLYGIRAVGVGGWFAVGSGPLRLEIDYSRRRGREEETETYERGDATSEYTWVNGWDLDAVRVVVTRHFREERRIRTHLLFGAGYYDSRSYSCNASRERLGGEVSYERPQECVRNTEDDAAAVFGGGIEIDVGARYFVRVQSSGFVVAGGNDSGAGLALLQAAMSEVLVGVGVRF